MSTIALPFYLKSKPMTGGTRRFGWVDVDVEVPEVEPSAVELAINWLGKPKDQGFVADAKCYYAHDQSIWLPAQPFRGVTRDSSLNRAGVKTEIPLSQIAESERRLVSLTFSRALQTGDGFARARPTAKGGRAFVNAENIDALDLNASRLWAKDNLIIAGGVLLKKAVQPSLVISGSTGYPQGLGIRLCHSGESFGLHFSHPDEEFRQVYLEGLQRFNDGARPLTGGMLSRFLSDAVSWYSLGKNLSVAADAAFNGSVLSSLGSDHKFRYRAIYQLACDLTFKEADWRDSFKNHSSEVRDLLRLVRSLKGSADAADDIITNIVDRIETLPRHGFTPQTAWFVERVLERYHDRPIEPPKVNAVPRIIGNMK